MAIKIKESKKNEKINFPGRRESRKSTFRFPLNCRNSTFYVLGNSKNQLFAFCKLQKINFLRFLELQKNDFLSFGNFKKLFHHLENVKKYQDMESYNPSLKNCKAVSRTATQHVTPSCPHLPQQPVTAAALLLPL